MKTIRFLLLLLLPFAGAAQSGKSTACAYYGENSKYAQSEICNYLSFASNQHAEAVVDNILEQVGLKRNFVVMECPKIENAIAVNLPSDLGTIRYIIYDNKFLERVDNTARTDWAAISILAHEVAHHLNGHVLDVAGSRHEKELEADEFSGFVLFKLGASLNESQAALRELQSSSGSSTHPPKSARLKAVETGWNKADKLSSKGQNQPAPEKTLSPGTAVSSYIGSWQHSETKATLKLSVRNNKLVAESLIDDDMEVFKILSFDLVGGRYLLKYFVPSTDTYVDWSFGEMTGNAISLVVTNNSGYRTENSTLNKVQGASTSPVIASPALYRYAGKWIDEDTKSTLTLAVRNDRLVAESLVDDDGEVLKILSFGLVNGRYLLKYFVPSTSYNVDWTFGENSGNLIKLSVTNDHGFKRESVALQKL